MKKYSYKVTEDNGGGLALFVFKGGRVIYAHYGYEYNPGQLSADLDALDAGGSPEDGWEGCENDPSGLWDEQGGHEYGYKLVVSGANGKRELYPEHMGAAARIEFGITVD